MIKPFNQELEKYKFKYKKVMSELERVNTSISYSRDSGMEPSTENLQEFSYLAGKLEILNEMIGTFNLDELLYVI